MSLPKLRAFGSQFVVFSDYSRPMLRLSALMELPVIYIYTHDSIGVGKDGPTQQPVEQIASLRAIPGLHVFRPGDANEVVEAWRAIVPLRHEPVALILSRQALPTLDRERYASAARLHRGGYVLSSAPGGDPQVILIGTGSEVALCVEAHERLLAEGVRSRVVSLPCWELFEKQSKDCRNAVLPPSITARVAVEQASTFGWKRYTKATGSVVGMRTFGASAPLAQLLTKFGFTADAVVASTKELL